MEGDTAVFARCRAGSSTRRGCCLYFCSFWWQGLTYKGIVCRLFVWESMSRLGLFYIYVWNHQVIVANVEVSEGELVSTTIRLSHKVCYKWGLTRVWPAILLSIIYARNESCKRVQYVSFIVVLIVMLNQSLQSVSQRCENHHYQVL